MAKPGLQRESCGTSRTPVLASSSVYVLLCRIGVSFKAPFKHRWLCKAAAQAFRECVRLACGPFSSAPCPTGWDHLPPPMELLEVVRRDSLSDLVLCLMEHTYPLLGPVGSDSISDKGRAPRWMGTSIHPSDSRRLSWWERACDYLPPVRVLTDAPTGVCGGGWRVLPPAHVSPHGLRHSLVAHSCLDPSAGFAEGAISPCPPAWPVTALSLITVGRPTVWWWMQGVRPPWCQVLLDQGPYWVGSISISICISIPISTIHLSKSIYPYHISTYLYPYHSHIYIYISI